MQRPILNLDTAVVWYKGVSPEKAPAKKTPHRISQVSRHWFQLEVLKPENPQHLGHGRDCRESGYNFLRLCSAWRIENHYLWQKFEHETGNREQVGNVFVFLFQLFFFNVFFVFVF